MQDSYKQIRLFLQQTLSLQELKTLFFHLGIDYESLGSNNKEDSLTELVMHIRRRERLDQLLQACHELFPQIMKIYDPQAQSENSATQSSTKQNVAPKQATISIIGNQNVIGNQTISNHNVIGNQNVAELITHGNQLNTTASIQIFQQMLSNFKELILNLNVPTIYKDLIDDIQLEIANIEHITSKASFNSNRIIKRLINIQLNLDGIEIEKSSHLQSVKENTKQLMQIAKAI